MTIDEAIKHCEEVADGFIEQGKCAECAAEHRQLADWLKELKQLREQTQWIPVSEKMPDHYEVVLACCNDDFITLASFSYKEDRWECLTNMSSNTHFPENEEVIAWMPLPKPYVPDINIGKTAESEDKE